MGNYKKGEQITTLPVYCVVPVFVEDENSNFSVDLPLFDADSSAVPALPKPSFPKDLRSRLRRHFQVVHTDDSHLVYAITSSLSLLFMENDFQVNTILDDLPSYAHDIFDENVSIIHFWKCVANKISLERWKSLVQKVYQNQYILWIDHPLQDYASRQIPLLNSTQRQLLARRLDLSPKRSSVLSLIKLIHDKYTPRPYGVICKLRRVQLMHSCVPSAQLEMVSGGKEIGVMALFDTVENDPVSICAIENNRSIEQRDRLVEQRSGESCSCLRCRYEVDPSRLLSELNTSQQKILARFYMFSGMPHEAKLLYDKALKDEPENPELWHALGAVALSTCSFLEAQRIWKRAVDMYPEACSKHAGISLQNKKMRAYQYWGQASETKLPPVPTTWKPLLPQAFLTKALDETTCKQIIVWAESARWTQQRHYAVPTYDVPVHQVEPLLQWFRHWFQTTMAPTLADQFGTSSSYYVHDAFCVRYEAGQSSNHLPVHTDESTHSFVLALNEDYEGGGTYFYDQDLIVKLRIGEVVSFRGEHLLHGGETVTNKRRYVIAAFLYHDDGSSSPLARLRKRKAIILKNTIRESKQQRTAFSFCFDTSR
jgi:tetratricopeptide (TPR) repeat protein